MTTGSIISRHKSIIRFLLRKKPVLRVLNSASLRSLKINKPIVNNLSSRATLDFFNPFGAGCSKSLTVLQRCSTGPRTPLWRSSMRPKSCNFFRILLCCRTPGSYFVYSSASFSVRPLASEYALRIFFSLRLDLIGALSIFSSASDVIFHMIFSVAIVIICPKFLLPAEDKCHH